MTTHFVSIEVEWLYYPCLFLLEGYLASGEKVSTYVTQQDACACGANFLNSKWRALAAAELLIAATLDPQLPYPIKSLPS